MRIIHLADTHLGYRQFPGVLDPERGLNQRECDVYDAWHRAVDVAVERRPAALVHAGDLFDSARPSPHALVQAIVGFQKLRDEGIPAVVIAGNHSTPRFRSSGSVFEVLRMFGVHAVWQEPASVRVNGLAIHAVPHEPDAQQLMADVRSLALDRSAEANILVLHGGLEAVKQSYGEVGEIALDPEVLAEVEFDYIALGHLHAFKAPQLNAIYPGSLERLDFADVYGDKTVLEIDLTKGAGGEGFVTRHHVPARPVFDFVIPCVERDPAGVLDAVDAALEGRELDKAIVRIRLDGIARDVYQALDRAALAERFAPCLHHVVAVAAGGLRVDESAAIPEVSFEDFARERMPPGVDADAVVDLAREYLREASAQEAEEAAAKS
jgi:DNA repair exonuclease SbcCD nuclease subunit